MYMFKANEDLEKYYEESECISDWLEFRSSGNDDGSSRGILILGNSPLCARPASISSSGDTEPISSSDDSSIP